MTYHIKCDIICMSGEICILYGNSICNTQCKGPQAKFNVLYIQWCTWEDCM